MTTKKTPAPKTSKPAPAAALGKFEDDWIVRVLAKSNPRRAGTKAHKRFSLYKTGMTVSAYREACRKAGLKRAGPNVRRDARKGRIAVEKPAKS